MKTLGNTLTFTHAQSFPHVAVGGNILLPGMTTQHAGCDSPKYRPADNNTVFTLSTLNVFGDVEH